MIAVTISSIPMRMQVGRILAVISFLFFNDTATTEIYTLSLHDALPISRHTLPSRLALKSLSGSGSLAPWAKRSEEHTSELQSQSNLVCRLLLEKKKRKRDAHAHMKIKQPVVRTEVGTDESIYTALRVRV